MSSVPLQFLVGATRLVAVYFALRCFEHILSALTTYSVFYSNSGSPEGFPMPWVMLATSFCTCVVLAIVVWVAAPRICKLATNAGSPPPEKPETDVAWNEVMIFLTGVLIVGWGIAWLAESLIPFFQSIHEGSHAELPVRDRVKFFMNCVLIGFGTVLMAKFHRIYGWMRKRKAE